MATRPAPQPAPRPIVIRRVKKVVGGGHHGGAWKVAYADFVTAMMAFFMLLWLLSNPDKEQLKGLAEYFSPSTASSKPGEATKSSTAESENLATASPNKARGGTATVPDASLRVMAEELRLLLQPTSIPRAEQQKIQMERIREGLRVSLMDDGNRSMFRGGTATLNPYARVLLAKIAGRLAQSRLQIAIEGHTDGTGGQSQSNWDLSARRALAARAALVDAGLTADRFSEVVALASTQPVYPEQPERPENRRITIVLLADSSPLPSDVSFRF